MISGISPIGGSRESPPAKEVGQAPVRLRTLSEQVTTAALRLFGFNPATSDKPYQEEHTSLILRYIGEINALKPEMFTNDEAYKQHVFAILAKHLSYYNFEALPQEIRHTTPLHFFIDGKDHSYFYEKTISLGGGLCDTVILIADGAPPLALLPGTFRWLDDPAKVIRTVGANLQGTTWKSVADEIQRILVPYLDEKAKECGVTEEPRFHLIGHSAGASATRLSLSHYNRLPPDKRAILFSGRIHAFSPPATSRRRAFAINDLSEQQKKRLLTTYLEYMDPISHMGGSAHAGKIIVAKPREGSTMGGHGELPSYHYLGAHIVEPYSHELIEQWSIDQNLSKATICLIAFVNFLGLNALVTTTNPILGSVIKLTTRLLRTLTHLSLALLSYSHILMAGKSLLHTGKAVTKLILAAALAPFVFLYSYWNKIIVPTIYHLTGYDFSLRDYAQEALHLL